MRKALVENGVVTNIIVVDPDNVPKWCADWPDASENAFIGGTYSNGVFTPPAAQAEFVPASISFPQLLIGLVSEKWVTEAEGDAWADGTLPAAVSSLISTLPPEQQFAARTRAKRPSEVLRDDPLVNALGAAQKKTQEELDAFFRTYAAV